MHDEDLNPEQWLGLPTPEEMWRQQAQLCAEECNMLQESLTEQRKRIASLVTMFVEADKERVRLRTELAKAIKDASQAHIDNSESWKKWHSESMARATDQAFFFDVITRLGGDPYAIVAKTYHSHLLPAVPGSNTAPSAS